MESTGCGPSLLVGAPSAPSGDASHGKNWLGGFSGKILAPGLIPGVPVSLLAFRQQPQSSYEIARHDEATHGPRAKRYEVRSLWGPAGAPSAPSGDGSDGKSRLGGLAGKSEASRAPGLIPRGAGDLNGLPPAVIEAVHRYIKSLFADPLDFVFRTVREIRRGLHLLQQISIAIALSRVLGEWP
jgi:hypothetical protein